LARVTKLGSSLAPLVVMSSSDCPLYILPIDEKGSF
jgi:hypothetical protein